MTAAVKHLVEEALRLAPEEREELVETLLSHSEPDEEWSKEWGEEIERRAEEVLSGKGECVSAEEAHRWVRQSLSEIR
jgi:putative addiction module component (TIGR02574 family)